MTEVAAALRMPSALEQAVVEAFADPVGQRIWQALVERTSTAGDLARAVGLPLDVVLDHLTNLCELGVTEVVAPSADVARQEYRAVARPMLDTEQFARLPLAARRGIFGEILDDLLRHVETASASGGFDRPDAHVSWTPLDLDEDGYGAVAAVMDEALARVIDIQAEVVERRSAGTAGPSAVRTEVGLLHFERAVADAPRQMLGDSPAPLQAICDLVEDLSDVVADEAPDWDRIRNEVARLRTLVGLMARGSAAVR